MLAKKLKKGDKIGVISPSENVKEEDFEDINESIELLKKNGYEVVIGKNAYKNTTGYGATAKEKAEDIHEMYRNKEIKAIFSIKGGFNSNSVYEYLDLELIKNNNKILCGYSDATSYINYIQAKTGNSCFIGPNLKSLNSWETDYSFKEMLNHFENGSNNLLREDDEVICIKEGYAKGKLIGGNLSLITNMLEELDFSNKIIFLEEFSYESPPAMVSNYLYKMKPTNANEHWSVNCVDKNEWNLCQLEVTRGSRRLCGVGFLCRIYFGQKSDVISFRITYHK